MRRAPRRLRHWRQVFDRNARFVWLRSTRYGGKTTVPGEPVPKSLTERPGKLRAFWEAGRIELADFDGYDRNVVTGERDGRPNRRSDAKASDLVSRGEDGRWRVAGIDGDGFKLKREATAAAKEMLAAEAGGEWLE